mgnify:CR=1 FL=1
MMIKKCGYHICYNFTTSEKKRSNGYFCSERCNRGQSSHLWRMRNQDYYNSEEYKEGQKEARRKRMQDPQHRKKITEQWLEAEAKRLQDPVIKEKRKRSQKKYNSSEKGRKRSRDYMKERREIDLNFRIKNVLRCRLYKAVINSGGIKSEKAIGLLGCSIEELHNHLSGQFTDGMSWDNYGDWHIDHIKPCAAFDLTKVSEQRECFHYTNLQPLWAYDNFIKNDTYEPSQPEIEAASS